MTSHRPTTMDDVNPSTRPAARAGQFYPGDPDAMRRAVDGYLAMGAPAPVIGRARRPARAVMLPHAGWVYCGATLGRTLGRITLPDTAIILGPRHTPYGPDWSIAPHERWEIPGEAVPVATDLVEALAARLPGLEREPEAHRLEHGSEVLLPFLRRMNPALRVVPIVLGRTDGAGAKRFAAALAEVVKQAARPVLLVISSDMNHFADEAETRRRDGLALAAMRTGEPWELAKVVERNQVSMCGVVPAVIVMEALRLGGSAIAPELVDYTTSAAASGDTSRVVGYAGVVIE
ncbi:MAG: AmmeMemoRadiSam system protein B [Planctomycetota bacterium]|nr:AmmeMemoRadiSam system protein B [Planctomycetota bacterium]